VLSTAARGSGTGQSLLSYDGSNFTNQPVLLINPGKPLSTRAAYAGWDGIDRGPLIRWREGRNDLEPAAIALVPEIEDILDWLRQQPGADFVRMSGSGSTCFALFAEESARDGAAASVPAHWWKLATRLR